MGRYVVRPVLGRQAAETSGQEGASGCVIFADNPTKARELGAKRLGRSQGAVEVIETEDVTPVIGGPDRPLTKEEADEIFNQGASVVPGSWEGV